MEKYIPLVARVFLSAIFIQSGMGKITGFSGTLQFMRDNGIPLTEIFLIGAIAFELLGALSVLLGYQTRIGALLLIIFLIPTTLIFHTNFAESMQVTQFLKNLAILGGLLMVFAYGPGAGSFDTPSRRY